jgi:hypothetical protein
MQLSWLHALLRFGRAALDRFMAAPCPLYAMALAQWSLLLLFVRSDVMKDGVRGVTLIVPMLINNASLAARLLTGSIAC